MDVDIKITS